MNNIYEEKYSLEKISNIISLYFEQISDITNFKIIKVNDRYVYLYTVNELGKNIMCFRTISEYEIYLLLKKASKIPIKYIHSVKDKEPKFKVGLELVRKH